MKLKYALFRLLVVGVLYDFNFTVRGEGISDPDFDSGWLPIAAQDSSLSFLEIQHNLGEVPALVEVLVKSTSEPNKDFIFKGIGTAGRDNDAPDEYGSVVYIYNENSVRIYAPNKYTNGYDSGYTIFTGFSEWWVGVNNQSSPEGLVKVRCWSSQNLPVSCYGAGNLTMMAGSNQTDETYMELTHGLNQWPALVNVRANLLDGPFAGWYSDGQGTNMVWFDNMDKDQRTGGLVYGYNDTTIRLWVSSVPSPGNVLFSTEDGWGVVNERGASVTGSVEIRAWCSLGRPTQTAVMLGPSVANEQLEILLPGLLWGEIFVSVKVKPRDGVNQGYLFDGIGGAMRGVLQNRQGTPCSYGGVVYAYDARVLRVWRPADTTGTALCIGSQMGHGVNSQATNNVDLIITVWTLGTTTGDISLSNNISSQLHLQIKVTPDLECVFGLTDDNIGIPISLRVLSLVPMLPTDSLSMCAFLFLSVVR